MNMNWLVLTLNNSSCHPAYPPSIGWGHRVDGYDQAPMANPVPLPQRYFLAEILKTSSIPPAELVKIIQERDISPQWDLMALPNGTDLTFNVRYTWSSRYPKLRTP